MAAPAILIASQMEKISFRESGAVVRLITPEESAWRAEIPILLGEAITLRELRASDAPTLLAMLSTEEVTRFINPLPTTIEGFEQLISSSHGERLAGRGICFGVVPAGKADAVGLFEVRQLDPGFATAEWKFALGSPYWGTGAFVEGASLFTNFSFRTVGIHRLEARAALKNGRANGALRKIGAEQEGVLRRSLFRNGEYLDQVLWGLIDGDGQ